MPKIVNHSLRREQLAEAAWRVIHRQGIEGVTVRCVAEEAGVSLGSLRHHFTTQSELLAYSMRLVSERIHQRLGQLPSTGDPRADFERMLGELVPLDDDTRSECEIWLGFIQKASTSPELRPLSMEVHEQLYSAIRRCLRLIAEAGDAGAKMDIELEALRAHALIDGLVVHGILYPSYMNNERIARIISAHVNSLCGL
ncbi:transcriptional regulator, TetR family [Paenibacillus sp. UNCCL117]|uniref:TetR/AcrR family transcriptional regulator n=1 Tax=unclassified Paenibacillus TaxID=185978 RepID=UPI00088D951B|nr:MULTISPECIES: TetR family transcriptional regulator C-terminal domain-containing protein [unclassified Paenibacillus]SDC51312.1 DNA-binding transcriptional regulator, AcrR family [Paenibacillus sp. cl123]SFW11482.1 transcriptional regulator, TetR family [Paenibacillus sp. UNCCL117]